MRSWCIVLICILGALFSCVTYAHCSNDYVDSGDVSWEYVGEITARELGSTNSILLGYLYVGSLNDRIVYKFKFRSLGKDEELLVTREEHIEKYNAKVFFWNRYFYFNVPSW